jgi:hypothetical protein
MQGMSQGAGCVVFFLMNFFSPRQMKTLDYCFEQVNVLASIRSQCAVYWLANQGSVPYTFGEITSKGVRNV